MMRRQPLTGRRLQAVTGLADSIAQHGLLSPIVAIRRAGRLIVVDGRKRIAALRRLAFQGRLPLSLNRIPYILSTDTNRQSRRAPVILSNRDLYTKVIADFRAGESVGDLSRKHQVSRQCIRDIMTLSRLSPVVRAAFFEKMINFSQARAYAAIPDPDAQLARLKSLGPFASPDAILGIEDRVSDTLRKFRDEVVAA